MKFIISNVLLCLVFSFTNAQTFDPVPLNREAFYTTSFVDLMDTSGNNNFCNYPLCILGNRIDSTKVNGGEIIYFFPRMIRHTLTTDEICSRDSWMGGYGIKNMQGDFYFFNALKDTIVIKPALNINDSWKLFTFLNGNYILATITSLREDTLIGSIDSVKIITLQAKDSSGSNVYHIFNNHQIELSKNFGFKKVFDIYHFPLDTASINLSGISNPDLGKTNLTAQKVFDYNIGDQFDRTGGYNSGFNFGYSDTYSRSIVINKITSSNLDSITYIYDYTFFSITNNNPTQGNLPDTAFLHDTISELIVFSRLLEFNSMPYEIFSTSTGGVGYSNSYLVNDTLHKHIVPYYTLDSICLLTPIGSGIFPQYTYVQGIGLTAYWNDDGNNNTSFETLVYYKKDSIEWGTPIDFRALTVINEIAQSKELHISPNPASDLIFIDFSHENINANIEIVNILGMVVLKNSIENRIDISLLTPGVYFIKVAYADKYYSGKFVKV